MSEIAGLLGIGRETTYAILDPGYAKRRDVARKASARRRDKEAKALVDQEHRAGRSRLAKSVGGQAEKAYAAVRVACAELDKALSGGSYRSQLPFLREALAHMHQAEDSLVTALRTVRSEAAA